MPRTTREDGALVFLHLSDIHFNKWGHDHYDVDRDLREQLELDVSRVRTRFPQATGVLVSGDIAFGGQPQEYEIAERWLTGLCGLAGCHESDVWCVPGNHDVDRSVYRGSQTLRDYHDRLRPADPEEVDERVATYLRDEDAARLLFRPISRYNDFAAKFGCESRPAPLAWQHELRLNDGSCLRLHGINSVLASDETDDNAGRKLIVGSVQARPREEAGVAYLVMCHHPPDWLLDGDAVSRSLNARARVQLFGHKHVQSIERIDNSLRIGAGAVHPVRKEKNWLPRYNWLALRIGSTSGQRALEVDVFPRVWDESRTRFTADYAACDGAESRHYDLPLEDQGLPRRTPSPGIPGSATGVTTQQVLLGLAIDVSGSMAENLPRDIGVERTRLESVQLSLRQIAVEARDALREQSQQSSAVEIFAYGFGFREAGVRDLLGLISAAKDLFSRGEIAEVEQEVRAESEQKFGGLRDLGRLLEGYLDPSTIRAAQDAAQRFGEDVVRKRLLARARPRIEARLAQIGDLTINVGGLHELWGESGAPLKNAEEFIYGATPLCQAIKAVAARFDRERQRRATKSSEVLFLLSDGEPTDGDPLPIAQELRDGGVTIVSCFVTNDDVTSPRRLFHKPEKAWGPGARLMFELASATGSDNPFVGFLERQGWTVPAYSRLFVQVNHSQILEEFVRSLLGYMRLPVETAVPRGR